MEPRTTHLRITYRQELNHIDRLFIRTPRMRAYGQHTTRFGYLYGFLRITRSAGMPYASRTRDYQRPLAGWRPKWMAGGEIDLAYGGRHLDTEH